MDTRTRRASWDEPRIGIPEVGAVDRVDTHAKASSYGIRLRGRPHSPESVKIRVNLWPYFFSGA